MSTPDRPLTRRQLKQMRLTGQVPVVPPAADEGTSAPSPAETPVEPDAPDAGRVVAADAAGEQDSPSDVSAMGTDSAPMPPPLAAERPAPAPVEPRVEPARSESAVESPPTADGADRSSGAARPLTRREARMLRTNSVPVTPATGEAPVPAADAGETRVSGRALPVGFSDGAAPTDTAPGDESAAPAAPFAPRAAPTAPWRDADVAAGEDESPKVGASFGAAVFRQAEEQQRLEREAAEREAQRRRDEKVRDDAPEAAPAAAAAPAAPLIATATAAPLADEPAGVEALAQAFQRSLDAGGSTATGASLILNDLPGSGSLGAPLTATGEILYTSSHTLPSGLSSRGAAPGTTDGKDVDATLMDGELPLHSSPTPIAASSAVSTSRAPGDVIRPPAPEKNQRLMLVLGVTAGFLGVALVGVIVYAFMTGVIG